MTREGCGDALTGVGTTLGQHPVAGMREIVAYERGEAAGRNAAAAHVDSLESLVAEYRAALMAILTPGSRDADAEMNAFEDSLPSTEAILNLATARITELEALLSQMPQFTQEDVGLLECEVEAIGADRTAGEAECEEVRKIHRRVDDLASRIASTLRGGATSTFSAIAPRPNAPIPAWGASLALMIAQMESGAPWPSVEMPDGSITTPTVKIKWKVERGASVGRIRHPTLLEYLEAARGSAHAEGVPPSEAET